MAPKWCFFFFFEPLGSGACCWSIVDSAEKSIGAALLLKGSAGCSGLASVEAAASATGSLISNGAGAGGVSFAKGTVGAGGTAALGDGDRFGSGGTGLAGS